MPQMMVSPTSWLLVVLNIEEIHFQGRETDEVHSAMSCYFVSYRLYSTTGSDKTRTNKRKICVTDTEAGASKVLKVEPPDTNDKAGDFPGFEVDQNGYVHVYTDGACQNNGRVGAKAGIGVWFADNHPL